jgi:hypothetical protein
MHGAVVYGSSQQGGCDEQGGSPRIAKDAEITERQVTTALDALVGGVQGVPSKRRSRLPSAFPDADTVTTWRGTKIAFRSRECGPGMIPPVVGDDGVTARQMTD